MPEAAAARRMLPWTRSCFVCGEANPRGLRARCFRVGDSVELSFLADAELVGWRDVIHGGLIATVLDEVMTWAAILGSRRPCFAAEITLRLRKPLAPGTACVAVASVAETRRRVIETQAWLRDDRGAAYARASGRYLPAPPGQLAASHRDFVSGEGCLELAEILDG